MQTGSNVQKVKQEQGPELYKWLHHNARSLTANLVTQWEFCGQAKYEHWQLDLPSGYVHMLLFVYDG